MELQAGQALFLMQTLMPVLQNEGRTTKSLLEAVPAGRGDYRPDEKAKSAMELAWHIAAAQQRFLGGVAAGGFDFAPIHKPEAFHTGADIAGWYGERFASNVAAISGLSDEQLAKVLDFRGVILLPAVAFLTFHMNHEIHHRGQLSTYLRPMGGKVPAIYGESYDSAEAKKAAGAA
jgi:uncharacterized damage-inducible protein DinB